MYWFAVHVCVVIMHVGFPGPINASIATEAKVVAKLKAEGISKQDIGREKFLEHAWDWTHQYGGTILEQLKKLGCSCDWDRTRFTMEDDVCLKRLSKYLWTFIIKDLFTVVIKW